MEDKLLYKDLTYRIRAAIFRVYNTLGFGHKETVYQKALAHELPKQKLLFDKEKRLDVFYDNIVVGHYVPDFVIEDKVILELKSLDFLPNDLEKQLIYYLKGTNYKLGLLVNFGTNKLLIKRKIWDHHPRESVINP